MAEKEISLMCMIGHGLSGLQLVCLLCLRATLSRSSYVTEQAANRLGHKHSIRLDKSEEARRQRYRAYETFYTMPVCVFSRTDPELVCR